MGPELHDEVIDVSETGISWISPEPHIPGERLALEGALFFAAMGLPAQRLEARVRDLARMPDGRFRIGAELMAPPTAVVAAMRRLVLRLQRHGDEFDSHVVDIIVLPEAT